MENYNSIIWGVVSGLTTAIIILWSTLIYKKMILPWYRNIIYKGYNVEGTWKVIKSEPPIRREIVFRLKQKASKITGTSTHTLKNKSSEGDYIKEYTLNGELNDRLLRLTTELNNKQRIGVGTVMIEIIGDGQKMKGWIAAYNSSTSGIDGFKCIAQKVD